jgi:hypothetical protein
MFQRFLATGFTFLTLLGLTALPVSAQVTGKITEGLNAAAGPYAGSSPDLPTVVGKVIGVALTLVGVLLLVYLIYAGFLWMTAGGDSKRVQEAKDIIKNTLIGLVIVTSAYAISTYVLTQLATISSGGSGPTQSTGAPK